MKVSLIFAVSLISFVISDELETDKQSKGIRIREGDINIVNNNRRKRETTIELCNAATNVVVQSVYVTERFFQLFIETLDGSRGWTADISNTMPPRQKSLDHNVEYSQPGQLGEFRKVDKIPGSQALQNDGKFKRVSASFLHFSDSPKAKSYLVMGLSAYEFEIEKRFYHPTGNVTPITDFFKEGEKKLLMPEDKLEEVVSVALIKWVDKHKAKDHAIYKIILKTVTKKLVKAFFKLSSKGEVISLNNEPFVPSVELLQDKYELNLLEESALYYVTKVNKLSMGYQFIKSLAFPIYYEYNPEENIFKEHPMRTEKGFNDELKQLGDKVPNWNRFIVSTETWLACPETTFCLGRSFDAVLLAGNKYYAIFDKLVYTLEFNNTAPGTGKDLESVFPISEGYDVDAAFTLGAMIFVIESGWVHVMTDIDDKHAEMLKIADVFPEMDDYLNLQVSAVVTLDNRKDVSDNKPLPSKLKSTGLSRNHRRHERAAQSPKEDIPKKMAYVFCSKDSGSVYQYQMETEQPPKFQFIAKKSFTEVNAALPFPVSLVFTADGKVVTIVNHFMIEQSTQTFFTETENQAKFTLIDKYFGCQREKVENELTKEFVQEYEKFAGPKSGLNVFADPADTHDLSSTSESEAKPGNDDEDKNEAKGSSSLIATANIIIPVVMLSGKILLKLLH